MDSSLVVRWMRLAMLLTSCRSDARFLRCVPPAVPGVCDAREAETSTRPRFFSSTRFLHHTGPFAAQAIRGGGGGGTGTVASLRMTAYLRMFQVAVSEERALKAWITHGLALCMCV
jgi:hypothetical protein